MGLFDRLTGKGGGGAGAPVWSVELGDHPVGLAPARAGKSIAVLGGSGTMHVLDAATGKTERSFSVHAEGALTMAASPHATFVVTGGMDKKACIVDVEAGAVTASLEADAAWVEHVAVAPDGGHVAIAAGKHVRVFASSGAEVGRFGPCASSVAAIAFSPDGKRLAVARYGGVDLVSLDGKQVTELLWKSSIVSVAWQPKERFLAAGCQDNAVHFWRLPTGDDSMMGGYPAKPKALAWSEDGTSLATGGGEEIVVWSFRGRGPEGSTPVVLKGHTKLVTVLAGSPADQRFASGGRDGLFCIWRPQRSETPVAQLAMSGPVAHVCFRGDGTHAMAADEKGRVVLLKLP